MHRWLTALFVAAFVFAPIPVDFDGSAVIAGLKFDNNVHEEVTVEATGDGSAKIATTDWVVFLHVNVDSYDDTDLNDERALFNRDTTNERYWRWQVDQTGKVSFAANGNPCDGSYGTAPLISDNAINEDEWYFMALVHDWTGTDAYAYLYMYEYSSNTWIADGAGGDTGQLSETCNDDNNDITICGHGWPSLNDEMYGFCAYAGYIHGKTLTMDQLRGFAFQPKKAFVAHSSDALDFFIDMRDTTPFDMLGNRTVSVTGTMELADNPPSHQ